VTRWKKTTKVPSTVYLHHLKLALIFQKYNTVSNVIRFEQLVDSHKLLYKTMLIATNVSTSKGVVVGRRLRPRTRAFAIGLKPRLDVKI